MGLCDEFGDRLRYVLRHRPILDSDIARRAAEFVERADDHKQFWTMHIELMTRLSQLTEENLQTVAAKLDDARDGSERNKTVEQTQARVDEDLESASASYVIVTPTF